MFILSKKKVIEQYKKLSDLGIVSYSHKTNPEITKILQKNTDSYFSIHNKKEISKINNKGKIFFFLFGNKLDEIKEILKKGITKFVVENKYDLENLSKAIDDLNIKIELLLRLKLKEHTIFTEKYYVFGFSSKELEKHIEILSKNKNIKKLGIHFHKKTQNVSEWKLLDELKQTISENILNKISYLNIGGGLPANYKNSSDSTINLIFKQIKELKSELNKYKIKLIFEPGRFIAAPSVKLLTKIKLIKEEDNTIIVDSSVFNTYLDTLIIPLKLILENEEELEKSKLKKQYTIKGITPDSADIIRYKAPLVNPKIGDTITFINVGAYNFYCDFSNLPKLKTKIVD